MAARGIPRRWRIFAEHLLRDPNATQAARAAGVSEKNARPWAYKTKQEPRFAKYFAERLQEVETQTRIQTHRILEELAVVAFSSVDDFTLTDDGQLTVSPDAPDGAIRAVSKIKRKTRVIPQRDGPPIVEHDVELALWDKNPAIANAMKHKALLIDRVKVDATVSRGPGRLTEEERRTALAEILGVPVTT